MATDLRWVEVPLGGRVEKDKSPINLTDEELLQLQDLTGNIAPRSLSLRKTSELVSADQLASQPVYRIGAQIRPDRKIVYAVIVLAGGTSYLLVRNPDSLQWVSVAPSVLGSSPDMCITPDVIRASGETGHNILLRIGTLPYIEGGVEVMPRQFHQTLGPQPPNVFGIGYVAWDGHVTTPHDDDEGDIQTSFIRIETTPRELSFGELPSWFGGNDHCLYFYSLVYEGGQESPPYFAAQQQTNYTYQYNRVKVTVVNINTMPFAVKAVNIYRKKVDRTASYNWTPEGAVLIGNLPIYKEDDNYRNWDIVDSPTAVYRNKNNELFIRDYNESSVIGGTYFDRQQFSHKVTKLSPFRKNQRVFSDRLFAWNVVADDGKVYGNRLYYSHVNGLGISCYDIIPPANYIEFPFNIVGLVSVRSHRIVVGDSKYAIGYFSGGGVGNWRIHEGETEIGCQAPDSVADTPYGAAYVGYDGIYVVNGFEVSPPYARGIIRGTSSTHDWTRAKAAYAQNEQEYVVVVPSVDTARNGILLVAVNFRTRDVRVITPPAQTIFAIGTDTSGNILLATNTGIYSLETSDSSGEANPSDTKTPILETGYRKFFGGPGYQQVAKVGIHGSVGPGNLKLTITGYPSGDEFVSNAETWSDELKVIPNAGFASPDFAHKIKMEYVAKDGIAVKHFRIDRFWVEGRPVEERVFSE